MEILQDMRGTVEAGVWRRRDCYLFIDDGSRQAKTSSGVKDERARGSVRRRGVLITWGFS